MSSGTGHAVPRREARHEVPGEERDVPGALAERRQGDGHDREAEVEVAPEAARLGLAREVAVRRRDDADVDGHVALAPEAPHAAVLEDAQELGLERRRELADLVEEERPAARLLEAARAGAVRARERAALVAEELALDEGLGQRGGVDGDERARGARRARVEPPRDELLARARLPRHEDGDVGRGDAVDEREDLEHPRVPRHDLLRRRLGREEPVDDREERARGLERLREVVGGAEAHGLHGLRDRPEARQDDDGWRRRDLARSPLRSPIPSRTGIRWSVRTSANGSLRAKSSASSPSRASVTACPSPSRMSRRSARKDGSSSATRMRAISAPRPAAGSAAPPRRRPAAAPASRRRRSSARARAPSGGRDPSRPGGS